MLIYSKQETMAIFAFVWKITCNCSDYLHTHLETNADCQVWTSGNPWSIPILFNRGSI